jgi:excisionase family DNA binding protein
MSTFDEEAQIRRARRTTDASGGKVVARDSTVTLDTALGVISLTVDQLITAQARAAELLQEISPMRTELGASPSRLVDATEAAAALGIKSSWLLARAREGRIPHVKLGKYRRFDLADVRAALQHDRA